MGHDPRASEKKPEICVFGVTVYIRLSVCAQHITAGIQEGNHCVLNGIPSENARHCCGVIYVKIGFSGKSLYCSYQRRAKKLSAPDAGHDKCNAATCPFVAEGKDCPYMPLNCEECVFGGKFPEQTVQYIGYANK